MIGVHGSSRPPSAGLVPPSRTNRSRTAQPSACPVPGPAVSPVSFRGGEHRRQNRRPRVLAAMRALLRPAFVRPRRTPRMRGALAFAWARCSAGYLASAWARCSAGYLAFAWARCSGWLPGGGHGGEIPCPRAHAPGPRQAAVRRRRAPRGRCAALPGFRRTSRSAVGSSAQCCDPDRTSGASGHGRDSRQSSRLPWRHPARGFHDP
jgi:hypothetical protein